MGKIIVASGGMYERRYGGNLNLRKQLSDGRTNEDLLRCTLCYEAHCFHCHRYLSFQDFMWADQCRFCHGPMSPQFSRRAWPEPQQLSLGQDCVLSKTSTAAGQWYADWTHQDAISAMAYAVDIAFKCNCCGGRDNGADASCVSLAARYDDKRRIRAALSINSCAVHRHVEKSRLL